MLTRKTADKIHERAYKAVNSVGELDISDLEEILNSLVSEDEQTQEEARICHSQGIMSGCEPYCAVYGSSPDCPDFTETDNEKAKRMILQWWSEYKVRNGSTSEQRVLIHDAIDWLDKEDN